MDPCPFVRLTVESLALKLPSSTKPAAGSGVHPSTTPCYAKLKLHNFPSQTLLLLPLSTAADPPHSSASFHLDPDALRLFSTKPLVTLKISVFTGRTGRSCGVVIGKPLGTLKLCVHLSNAPSRSCVYHNGWMKLGGTAAVDGQPTAKLHLTVRSEPDPRFVFQFGGEPECSPIVFQIQENIRQPVFSCKFSADRSHSSRSLPSDFNNSQRGWTRTISGGRERTGRERKGWLIIVYDLSGSAVAAASMVTPFVPSPGSDGVSRSNPGAWLILCPSGVSISSWKPWGRLEAWRERGRGPVDGLGYKFELITNSGLTSGIPIAQGSLSVRKGGRFCIDGCAWRRNGAGLVMGSSVGGEGKTSKPVVEVSVACVADAALFIALAAAVDLCMDACRLFSTKLRKEFSHDHQNKL